MLLIIPILAMLALEFIVPSEKKPSAKLLLLLLGGGVVFLIIVRLVLPTAWIYPEGETIARVRGQVAHLTRTPGWEKKPILILEGSSATEYGIDGMLLEQLLAKKNRTVTVVQFSLPGANHFERLWMLQLFLEALGKKRAQALVTAPTILFSEVFDAYDQHPLYLFKKEAYSLRTIQWLYPWNALVAWLAAQKDPMPPEGCLEWTLLEHVCLNQFSVGAFSSFQPLNYGKTIPAFCPLHGTKENFDYSKMTAMFEKSLQLSSEMPAAPFALPGWSIYYQEFQKEFSGKIQTLVFYALPTFESQRRAYQCAFAMHLPPNTMMLGPASPTFMSTLMHENFWFDGVHPQGAGAMAWTTWFADEVEKNWDRFQTTPWK